MNDQPVTEGDVITDPFDPRYEGNYANGFGRKEVTPNES